MMTKILDGPLTAYVQGGQMEILKILYQKGIRPVKKHIEMLFESNQWNFLSYLWADSFLSLEEWLPTIREKILSDHGGDALQFVYDNGIDIPDTRTNFSGRPGYNLCYFICGINGYSHTREPSSALRIYCQNGGSIPSTLPDDLSYVGKINLLEYLYSIGFKASYNGVLNSIRGDNPSVYQFLYSRGVSSGSCLDPTLPNFAVSMRAIKCIKLFWDLFHILPDEAVSEASDVQEIVDFCREHR